MRSRPSPTMLLALAVLALAALVGCTDERAPDGAAGPGDAGPSIDAQGALDADATTSTGLDAGPAGGDAAQVDATPADAAGSPDAGDTSRCAAAPTYGRATLTQAVASGEGSSSARVNLEATALLDASAKPDQLSLLLYSDNGVFGPTLAPGTYALSGDELDFATCGLCVLLDANLGPPAPPEMVYFATGGTVEITELGANFRATLRDVTFEHVTLDLEPPYATHAVGDGCVSRIDEVTFQARIN